MKNTLKYLKLLVFILFVLLLIYYIAINFEKLKETRVEINWPLFTVSLVIYSLYKFGQANTWYYITRKTGTNISYGKTLEAWFMSQLGRYIPGKVFYYGGRLYYYHKEGVSKTKITYFFIIENVLTFIAAAFILLISFPFISLSLFENKAFWWVLVLTPLFLVFIHPKIFQKSLNILLIKLKRQPFEIQLRYIEMLKFLVMLFANWFLLGLGFCVLILSMSNMKFDLGLFVFLTGGFAFSIVVGMISIFAPSGIGVRESVLVFILKEIMSETMAVIYSVTSRVWLTIGDFIIVGLVLVASKLWGARERGNRYETYHPNPVPERRADTARHAERPSQEN
jgi:hypothetical protein